MSKILVTGSTGIVGSRVVRELVSRRHSVRALVRTGGRARFDSRVEVVEGDFTHKNSLRNALHGVSRMYLVSNGPDIEEYEINAVEVAKAAGLELVVKQSVIGAQYKATDFQRWHRNVEERIEAAGLPHVFLRPTAFDSNALWWADTIKGQSTVYGTLADTSIPVIDPEDIAAVAAVALSEPGHAGKIYELSGPESLTTEQQVNILGDVLGRPLKYVNVPDTAARDSMLGMGMPPKYVDALIGLFQTLRNIGRIEPTQGVKNVLGREARSFQQWAEANAGAFQPTEEAAARV